MEKSIYTAWSNEKLVNRRNSLKGASIGLGIVALIAILISAYLFFSYGFKDLSAITFIPVFILPITFLPMLIFLSQLNKEIKSRNIK